MSNTLAGKLALVTGAGGGIGRATCKALAREGAKVIAADVNVSRAEDTVALLDGTDHLALYVDVSEVESVQDAFKKSFDHFGNSPTVLVNSAGIARPNLLLKLTPMDFDSVTEVNLKGTFLVIQTGVNKMIESKASGGSIVNIASVLGKTGAFGQCSYSASKAGIEALTKTAAKEFGQFGVRVNAVLPGLIDTEMIKFLPEETRKTFLDRVPLGRIGQPEDVAELVLFLVSDRSSYINGASIEITGGVN